MIVDQRSSNTIKMMKTLAVMMATLLAGGCASVQSQAGASHYKDCLAKAQRAAAEVNEMEEVVSEVDEDVLALCLDSGHGRAVSLVTVAKVVGVVVGVIILVPFTVVLCVLDPVGCVKGLVGLFAR